MQLKKQLKKPFEPGKRVIPLPLFNPALDTKRVTITNASFLYNMEGPTHVVIHTKPKHAPH